ncbi:MAG: nitroreductase family protein [Kiritimatiellia bacterium]|nr:nitroreductase family protein [Kiritimatiellia bacterium]
MTILDCLLTRRSIRKFTGEPLTPETLRALLDVFMSSPSAADARPWHCVVVEDRAVLAAMADRMPHCEMLREAGLGLVICGDPSLEKIPGFWVQDCAAATQSVLIAAHGLGLGGVWIGLHPVPDRESTVRELLGLPAGILPFSIAVVGLPAEKLPREDRYDPARVHRNRW